MRRGIRLGRRLGTVAVATLLALSLAGDRARSASVPAIVQGQDPLEVLKLKVRPNVIIILDSSGSMTQTVDAAITDTGSGDHPRSKLYQAKSVLQSFIQQNQAQASFQFATYTQVGESFDYQAAGNDRFQYWTTDTLSPSMTTNNLTVLGDAGNTTRGLQSWQDIRPGWNKLYYGEGANVVCTATVAAPQFFATGAALATALTNAMNSATCTGGSRTNTYVVTYTVATGLFSFATSAGAATFNIRWADATGNNIAGALGKAGAANSGQGSGTASLTVNLLRGATRTTVTTPSNVTIATGATITISSASRACFNGAWVVFAGVANGLSFTYSTDTCVSGNAGTGTLTYATGSGTTLTSGNPLTLLRRATAGAGPGVNSNAGYEFTETVAGSPVRNFQLSAGRLWNGEVVRVQSDGTICGMTYPTAVQQTNPPSVTLQLVANGCGGDVVGQSAVFKFAGGSYSGNSRSCRGSMSRVPLIPCDLAMPPAATQFTNAFPYIDLQSPFTGASGTPVTPVGYTEKQDGTWGTASVTIQPSAKADGSTPLANSLIDIKGLADGANNCLIDQATSLPCSNPTTQTCVIGVCSQRNFAKLWNVGQAASVGPPQAFLLDAIKNHLDPKEKTIVLFVTDGNDTCSSRGIDGGGAETDPNALRAAYYAERLNTPLDPAQSASAVQTYMIGFGGAFSGTTPTRLNWIAWGGSGLGLGQAGQPDVPTLGTACQSWGTGTLGDVSGASKPTLDGTGQTGSCAWNATAAQLTTARASCTTCQDAFVAPDAATLATQLQSIIDQGAASGEFTAQQSITESVFEYADVAGAALYDSRSPSTRFQALVPTKFVSSFSLPGFNGQLRAYQNDGVGNSVLKWDAGLKLQTSVRNGNPYGISNGMIATCPSAAVNGNNPGWCYFTQLHNNTTDVSIGGAGSGAAIKRRIYTTSRNGVFNYTPASLMGGAPLTAGDRLTLWPPTTAIAPTDYTSQGSLDLQIGLPDSAGATCTLRTGFATCLAQWWSDLQTSYRACLGSNLPAACTGGTATTRMQAARREARDMILAFMAGAEPNPSGTGWARTLATASPANAILYKARSWVLADSTLATAAVVTPPLPATPDATPYTPEYLLFRDGPRGGGGLNPDSSGTEIAQGFGLRNPDNDQTVGAGQNDTRTPLKPVMTVVYAPANDMLHAFRAGPNCGPSTGACGETGGEELWGFVPYDELNALGLRLANNPQGRANHVYMLARGVRFSDVFVPGAIASANVGGVSVGPLQGVWRRIMYFGRGIGGKYMTALDVTAPGPYTANALATMAPIPLWSRGNPDTQNGLSAGTASGNAADTAAYAKMGETWSLPVVAYVDAAGAVYSTARRAGRPGCPGGSSCAADYVLFVGSGYSKIAGEGTTFYTLDALSGDVVAAVDVETTAAANGLTRSPVPTDQQGVTYRNAIVADPAGFNPKVFSLLKTVHPAASQVKRVYVGDLYGRVWKFLTARPDVAIPIADLGADQPVGSAASLLGVPPYPQVPVPYIFLSSGGDSRKDGPFRVFAFRDDGSETDTTIGGTVSTNNPAPGGGVGGPVTTFLPVVSLYTRTYDQGTPQAACGLTAESFFRGTVQPTTAFECSAVSYGTCSTPIGRVFFAGTRLSLPNTKYAPPTPLACGLGQYPCRSQFDSIVYALGATSGLAAYDLNAVGDDAYRIFLNSRIAAITMQADPDPGRGGSSFQTDEGLMKGTPKPPPPPGVPPTATTATANVLLVRTPGEPAPSVRFDTTVCQ